MTSKIVLSPLYPATAMAVAFALAACGGDSSAKAKADGAQKQAERSAAVPIRAVTVESQRVPRVIELSGSLSSPEDASIAAEVDGKLVRVAVDLGDRVQKGQLLAQIAPEEFRLRMQQAQASSTQADANLARVERLAKTEMVAAQQLDDARSVAAQAKAAFELAQKKLADTEVRAPFQGAVAKRLVSLGEYVRTGQQLFEVVVTDDLKLTGEVPERYLAQVKKGNEVTAHVEAYAGQRFQGKIDRISPVVNPGSRSFTVEARIDNKAGMLKPGLFARAELDIGDIEDAVVVPESAVKTFAGVTRVYKIEGAVAREVQVTIERNLPTGGALLAPGPIKSGDRVATEGIGRLADGMEVTLR